MINHERSSWGNDAPLVQPSDVAAARRESPPAPAKTSPRWSGRHYGFLANAALTTDEAVKAMR